VDAIESEFESIINSVDLTGKLELLTYSIAGLYLVIRVDHNRLFVVASSRH
jgi:hypothetical protein